ncbi:hypothetical protein [Marinobacter sp. NFXS9]|uniref:hypothetical protein n=1 Tax=Marinobacter sp. NFXS9 TaxID=2818433 RepID=UPI0032E0532C
MGHYDSEIKGSERKINALQSRVHETFKRRDENVHKHREWESACREFRSQYDRLAFPGGLEGAYERIVEGDPQSIEAALCFVEVRPFFFRSGYMYKDILRKLGQAPLKGEELARYRAVKQAYLAYRASKNT